MAFPASMDGLGGQALSKLFWGCLDGVRGGLSLLPSEDVGTTADKGATQKAPGHCAPPATGTGDLQAGPRPGCVSWGGAGTPLPLPHCAGWRWSLPWCEDTSLSWDSESRVLFIHSRTLSFLGQCVSW